ncbi:uncharacterized protein PGTG_19744 [Puccinia graminis f. sp. tritici CRL 75-36-700-3]|uniref:Uncharacterized protein n=1 Tax=Puccinia graminis f. sp. tritici (strain CRL 75-36-700-3 / race SCCL) TaxID=418459 RepID=E3LBK2_PUCGT|nr:uncharacterized protein PGTG_19744 [Puccinia graminis f. sp. tritici CRL 75-36-700-3]EFP93927.2 hypothetical protein PGTG_19744 [Puccinia graminis f. sp. tritici CRL 75-36-700-3]
MERKSGKPRRQLPSRRKELSSADDIAPFSIALSSLDIPLTPAGEARRSYTTSTSIFPHFRSPPLHSSVRFNARFDLLFASTLLIIEQRATGDDLNAHVYRPCQLIVSNLAY